ncbi:MAG: pilus assembly PilX N-terminal domain-containing protein [Deltaproteobacteria bacterium]|uniref:Pilus assembly PilX N-terminal domain-containing protein n=1 Tax=Candidatus Zymogenus saltonus TaxID=2844893 RepID=A0A9D8K9J4_9DELT|nr:pilus assembly PilX N-terminal domain-containing protein [Candidatus Zymogenus saltonus]
MKRLLNKIKGDESGLTLIVVMMFLFLLTILGMTMYFMSSTDLNISRNVFRGARSFYAAEAGVSEAIARLNLSASDPKYDAAMYDSAPFDINWSYDLSTAPQFKGKLDNGDSYEVNIKHKTIDDDDDPTTPDVVVTYDKGYFPSITYPAAGEGYAVEVITSKGRSSDGETVVVLEISKIPMDIKVEGAITANSEVNVIGNFCADGRDHDMEGNLGGAGNDTAGVRTTSGNSITLQGSADVYGTPPTDNTLDPNTYPNSPEEVLGLTGASASDYLDPANCDYYGPYDGSIGMNNGDPLTGITYITGDYPGPKENGSGILIIHNPNFNPCKYEASTSVDNTHPCWDTAWENPADPHYYLGANPYHSDSTVQPAKLGNYTSNATFKGLIIADLVDKIAGTPVIIGAMVSLSSIDIQKYGTGNADVLYSSEALNNFASMGFSKKISWHKE